MLFQVLEMKKLLIALISLAALLIEKVEPEKKKKILRAFFFKHKLAYPWIITIQPVNTTNTPTNGEGEINPRGQDEKFTACRNGTGPCPIIDEYDCGRIYDFMSEENQPWYALIINETGVIGDGILLDGQHILTTNVVNIKRLYPANLLLYIESQNVTSSVSEIRTSNAANTNLAVLKLPSPVPLNYNSRANKICLPPKDKNFIGNKCIIRRWEKQTITTSAIECTPGRRNNASLCIEKTENSSNCKDAQNSPLICQDDKSKKYHLAGIPLTNTCKDRRYGDVSTFFQFINSTLNN